MSRRKCKPEDYVSRRGEAHVFSKLTDDDVREIRRARGKSNGGRMWARRQAPDVLPLKVLAERFGITESAVSNIARRVTWRHVP